VGDFGMRIRFITSTVEVHMQARLASVKETLDFAEVSGPGAVAEMVSRCEVGIQICGIRLFIGLEKFFGALLLVNTYIYIYIYIYT